MRKKLIPYLETVAEFLLLWTLSVLSISTIMISVHLMSKLFKALFPNIIT